MIPMASSMVPLHSLPQDDQNEVQDDIFEHVMPLKLAFTSGDADGAIISITAFLGSR